ncbi:MAG: insulinase family protein [Chloroflexi bacterium]|nr:insulinase family protein [Chloroflexota bacterium]
MYQKTTLGNGLRIVSSIVPHSPSVTICFFVGVGSRYEPDQQAGVSHFIEHMVFKGTPRRPTSKDISEAIEGVGGILNAGTDKEMTAYWCKVAKPHFGLALDVLVDMLLHSLFAREEVERERQVIIEELNMTRDSPSQRVDTIIDELLWPNHPLGRDIAGTAESVTAITDESMRSYLATHYQPDNTVVSVAGDFRHEDMVDAIGNALSEWSGWKPHACFLPYKEQLNPRLFIENRETEQAHICIGLPGVSILDQRHYALDLLNVILGKGMSSRLFTEIRDKLGLAYSISSYSEHLLDSGALTVYAGVDPQNLRTALTAIMEQLRKLKEPVPQAELTKAKELSKGRLLMSMEDTRNVTAWTGTQEILMGRILTVDQIISIVDSLTVEELQKVAEEVLLEDKLRLAVVGPVKEDAPLGELLKL